MEHATSQCCQTVLGKSSEESAVSYYLHLFNFTFISCFYGDSYHSPLVNINFLIKYLFQSLH